MLRIFGYNTPINLTSEFLDSSQIILQDFHFWKSSGSGLKYDLHDHLLYSAQQKGAKVELWKLSARVYVCGYVRVRERLRDNTYRNNVLFDCLSKSFFKKKKYAIKSSRVKKRVAVRNERSIKILSLDTADDIPRVVVSNAKQGKTLGSGETFKVARDWQVNFKIC